MKKILVLLFMLPLFCFAQKTENNKIKKWNVGVHFVHRSFKAYEDYSYNYPRLSTEYSFTKCSSAEFMIERIGKTETTHQTYPAYYPISVGYKLNILPWFTKNEWLVNNLKVYNSLRYTLVLRQGHAAHQMRYAPGIECYVYKNLGLSSEFVFGQAMKTTFAMGVKYRF